MPVWKREMLDMAGRPFERLSYDREYDQALSYLYNLQKFGIKFGLSKTENLLRAFNNPHRELNCLHIGGSNGKGSVAAMLASIYSRAGYKVGLFTSPHLVDFRERFQINGRLISKAQTLDLIKEIKEKALEEEPPTFFEFVTAMALIYFSPGKGGPGHYGSGTWREIGRHQYHQPPDDGYHYHLFGAPGLSGEDPGKHCLGKSRDH